MQFKTLAAAAALVLAAPAFAAVAPASTGNGELFFVAQDAVAKVSYTLDLGVRMDTVIACETSGGAACKTYTFDVVGDANWTAFDDAADLSIVTWAVMALDSTGALAANTHRLVTTVAAKDTSKIGSLTNQQLSLATGSTQGGQFFGALNATGTHAPQTDYAVNGSSINSENVGSGFAYFGKAGGLTPTLNGNAPFNVTNVIGNAEVPLYLLSRSGTGQTNKVTVNALNQPNFDFYTSFDGQNLVVAVPEASTYALMISGLLVLGLVARRRRG